jgi:transposase InsO family protein
MQQVEDFEAMSASNAKLRDVLNRHRSVFVEELPIKTAEQIAAATKFSIILVGRDVQPVKQRERRVSLAETAAATKWVQEEVAAGRMEPSNGQWAAQLVIVPKRNEKGEVSGWRICGDYRNLNVVTKGDAEPLPLVQAMFDQLNGMQYFSKLDLLKGFNQIPVDQKSRELMAVSTPVGLYQPIVMPFGVKNAPGTFQREMRRVLQGRLNKGVFVFVDDILIYTRTEDEHLELIEWVLGQLKKEGYYVRPDKCQFLKAEVSFLGHIVNRHGLSMQQHKVEAVRDWPQLKSVRDVRAFLGLAGYYRRFVQGFSEIARPLTDLTHVADNKWFSWGPPEQKAFDTLKQAMIHAPVLAHPDPYRQWTVQTDASGFAIGAVLSQKQDDGTVRPVAYWSQKLVAAPRNYSATERELMAIVEAVRHWRSYLHGSPYPVQLLSDHKPLVYLNSKADLGQRLGRWMEELCDLTFEITYVKGKDNAAADALSRRSDHEAKGEAEAAPANWKVKMVEPQSSQSAKSLVSRRRVAGEWLAGAGRVAGESPVRHWRVAGDWMEVPDELSATASGTPAAQPERSEHRLYVESLLKDAREAAQHDSKYQLMLAGDDKQDGLRRADGLVYSRNGVVYIPNSRPLRTRLLELAHDATGHFGRVKTIERLSRHCVWSGMTKEVEDYCRSCAVCSANKSSNDLPAGLLKPLPIPERVWDSVGIDFVGPFPKSKEGNDYILVLIDRFSKMLKLRACSQKITASGTGKLLLEMMLDVGRLPSSIVSDRDVRFTAAAWGQLWRGLKTELKMSTAYHPQTDGQTERMNRTMQTVLRAYAEKREDWEEWLPFVAAAYNSTQQESTKRTPFELNFPDARSIDPLQWAMKESSGDPRGVSVEADRTLKEMQAIWDETRANLVLEQAKQKKYADRQRREVKYKAGDRVWLSTRNLPTYRGKLQDKWIGPFVVTEVMSAGTSVRLDLQGQLGKTHPVFHVNLLKPYDESELEWPGRSQPNRPAAELIDGEVEYNVEAVIDKKTDWETRTVTKLEERPEVRTRSGRVLKPTLPPRKVTTTERVPVVWYKVLWTGWEEADASWKLESDLNNSRALIDEYELRMKQRGTGEELGVATVVQWRLQDKQTTVRSGQPTVRCSYLSAAAAARSETERATVGAVVIPRVSTAVCGLAVVCSAAAKASDPPVLGWSTERSRAVRQAWIDGTQPCSPSSQGPNRLSHSHHSQPPKPSG